MGKSTRLLQFKIGKLKQVGNRMGGEKFRSHAFGGGLSRDGFRPVLAKFHGRGFSLGLRPGTSRAVESIELVYFQECSSAFDTGFSRLRVTQVPFRAPNPPAGLMVGFSLIPRGYNGP